MNWQSTDAFYTVKVFRKQHAWWFLIGDSVKTLCLLMGKQEFVCFYMYTPGLLVESLVTPEDMCISLK